MNLSEIDWAWVGIGVAVVVVLFSRMSRKPAQALRPGVTSSLKLIARRDVNHNTRIFRFGLGQGQELGLPIGKHIVISATIKDKPVSRAYTPVASEKGYFDLLVKIYYPTERFPTGGLMSQYLDRLQLGDCVNVRGPVGGLEYLGKGNFKFQGIVREFKKVGMIAGGTGITPMLQIAKAVTADNLQLSLLFANQTPNDILLKDEIASAGFESVAYTVDRPDSNWKGLVGFIDEAKVKASLPQPASDVLILVCGPPAMIELACAPALDKYQYEYVHIF